MPISLSTDYSGYDEGKFSHEEEGGREVLMLNVILSQGSERNEHFETTQSYCKIWRCQVKKKRT